MSFRTRVLFLPCVAAGCRMALKRPGVTCKIYPFPADRIPRVDGDASDWTMVPESYVIGVDQLQETVLGACGEGP